MRLYSLTVFMLLFAVPMPLGFKFGHAVAPSKESCEAARDNALRQHPDFTMIIDCVPYEFEVPGRSA